jgi:hypothetical protein
MLAEEQRPPVRATVWWPALLLAAELGFPGWGPAIHAGSRLLIGQAGILGGYWSVNIASVRVVARGIVVAGNGDLATLWDVACRTVTG